MFTSSSRRLVTWATLAASDLGVLLALRPDWARTGHHVRHPYAWVAQAGADGAGADLAALALWLVAAWLGLGLVAALLTRLPGLTGRIAAGAARGLLPGLLLRATAGAAGLAVLAAPALAGATPAPAGGPSSAAVSTSASAAPIWPTDQAASRGSSPAVTIGWPTDPHQPIAVDTQPSGTRPTTASGVEPPVTVAAGDTLWAIAARHLGSGAGPAEIAAQWPQWYATNRALIGPDPGVIRPGQVLQPPPMTEHPMTAHPMTEATR